MGDVAVAYFNVTQYVISTVPRKAIIILKNVSKPSFPRQQKERRTMIDAIMMVYPVSATLFTYQHEIRWPLDCSLFELFKSAFDKSVLGGAPLSAVQCRVPPREIVR